MLSKRRLFKGSNLCVIVDKGTLDASGLIRVAAEAARAGADIIQYRDKSSGTLEMIALAAKIRSAVKRYGSAFVVNDRIEVAAAVCADGVHLGRGDTSPAIARALLGRRSIIGVSATTPGEARQAKKNGADYIGAGPVFRTPIKKEKKPLDRYERTALLSIDIPVMAIGGITHDNAEKLTRQGYRAIAVIRAIAHARDPYRATQKMKALLAL